ncbi:hypothetical protein JCM8547_007610 [Rhodosporidiobolus lusitaniae]
MPPRAQQRPPQSLTPAPNQQQGATASPIAQLNPQQLAALQDHIRTTRVQTGQEVTPAMITEWMVRNGIHQPQQQQQQQQPAMQQQQQQQVPQQQQQQGQQGGQQGNVEAVLHHLYPPQLAGNPPAALQHLQNVLFPPNQGHQQSPFLKQVMMLAQNGRLSQEQMAQLKQAVAMKNGTQAQQQQQQQQQPYPQQVQQLQAVQMQQQQPQLSQQGLPPQPQPTPGAVPSEQTATQAVQQLRNRVHHIEALLGRPDVNEEQRAKMQAELELAQANLAKVFKMLLAAQQQQQQAQQAQAQVAAAVSASGAAPGQPVNMANLQEAQRQAMERKAREIQAQQVAAAQAQAQAAQQQQQQQQLNQQQNGGFRTASPAMPVPGQGPLPPGQAMRQSPSLGGSALPALDALASLPPNATDAQKKAAAQAAAAQQAAQAAIAAAAAANGGKKLTKKQQQEALQLSQQQAAQQQQASQMAMQQATALAQQAAGGGRGTPAPGGGGGGAAYGAMAAAAAAAGGHIPGQLNVQAPTPETFPAPRPTISGGMANNPSISTPAIVKPSLSSSFSGAGGSSSMDAFGGGGTAVGGPAKEVLPNKDNRVDDSKGRTVSKRKIRELVEAVDPEERLSDEVEDLLLEICDEFIDSVTRFGCQLAKHRKSDRLEVKDLALHLERSYNIRVPGFAPDEGTRQGGGSSSRRVVLPPGHAARLAAVREGGRRR